MSDKLDVPAMVSVVFTDDAGGERSVLPAAKISLDGATHFETQSNGEGKFSFSTGDRGRFRNSLELHFEFKL